MPDKIILYDQFNQPIQMPKSLDGTAQAAIGEKIDRWATWSIRDISPDMYERVMRNTSPLWEKQALCDRIYSSGHFLAIAEDRASTIGGWDWSVQPFTDRPGQKAKPEDQAVADSIAEKISNAANLTAYFEHLAWGELYFISAAETIWDPNTYLPLRFELIDGVRMNWWKNQVMLLTDIAQAQGEPLRPGNWTLHSRNLQNPHKARLARANAFWHMLTSFAVIDYAALSEKYNKPIPIGYFTDDSQRDALIEALMQIGEQFVGAFPQGTEIDFYEAIAAAKDIPEGLIKLGYDQSTKATCGHVLVVEAKSGSGTLAGKGAQMTNQKVARGVANRVGDSVKQGLIRPLVWFHHGAKFISRLPSIQFKARNVEEEKASAETFVAWNAALASSDMAVDPEHIREVGGIPKIVPRAAPAGLPPAEPTPGQPPPSDEADAEQSDEEPATQKLRPASMAGKTPKIRTVTDVIATSALLGQKAEGDKARRVLEMAKQAVDDGLTVAQFRNQLWEMYDTFDSSKSGELITQGMTVAGAIGTGNAAVRAGK